MKVILACLLLGSPFALFADSIVSRFVFHPFAKEDVAPLEHPLPEYFSDEDRNAISIEELRGVMTTGESSAQHSAARELIKRGDLKTILRVIYALKQGNVAAEHILSDSNSLAVIPYLMEDVAHGSLDYYGTLHGSDFTFGNGRVRVAAMKSVSDTLFSAPEFTEETMESLKAIGRGHDDQIQGLSDKCRYLVQWWLLNEEAFVAGKWKDTQPLPQQVIYAAPKEYTPLPRDEKWDREMQSPVGSPAWELAEQFEAWAERIVDPTRRNLDFVALSWDGTKVIEHSPISLDPKARTQDRESRKSPAPRNPPESEFRDGGRRTSWIVVAAALLVVLSIIRWIKRKPAANT